MAFDHYPAIDENNQFPLIIRQALAASDELKSMVVPMTQSSRNNLTGFQLWPDRLIFNTTTSRINRYNATTQAWENLSVEEPGIFKAYGGSNPPASGLATDGSVVSRGGINAALFGAIGTTYNTGGEASDKFRLPDTRGKVLVGIDAGQPEFAVVGKTGGEKNHVLTIAESASHSHGNDPHNHGDPGHSHGDNGHNHDSNWKQSSSESGGFGLSKTSSFTDRVAIRGGGQVGTGTGNANITGSGANLQSASINIQSNGGNQGHNNLQPYLAINYYITL